MVNMIVICVRPLIGPHGKPAKGITGPREQLGAVFLFD